LLPLRFQNTTILLTQGTLLGVYKSEIAVPYLVRKRR